MARRTVHDHTRAIEGALADAWRSDDPSLTSQEVAAATGLSVGQVQRTGRFCFSQRKKDDRVVIDTTDADGARIRVRVHYLRGTFMLEPEQGWSDYWASKPDDEDF